MNDVVKKGINADLDKSNMQGAIMSFPSHIAESFEIMTHWSPMQEYVGIQNIMILGMGGSAIGGDIVRVIAQHHCSVPIIVNRSYNIPKWVNSDRKSVV